MAMSFFPSGQGKAVRPLAVVSDPSVQLAAAKKAEWGHALILRLFETTGRRRIVTVRVPVANLEKRVDLQGFEIKTLRVDPRRRIWTETDLMEQPSMPK